MNPLLPRHNYVKATIRGLDFLPSHTTCNKADVMYVRLVAFAALAHHLGVVPTSAAEEKEKTPDN